MDPEFITEFHSTLVKPQDDKNVILASCCRLFLEIKLIPPVHRVLRHVLLVIDDYNRYEVSFSNPA